MLKESKKNKLIKNTNWQLLQGKFITFEGTEGVGKTTQVNLLIDFLKQNNVRVLRTREPGGTILAEKIREIFLDKKNKIVPEAELLLVFAARVNHLQELIIPALNDDLCVICDRYIDSTYAYQGYGRAISTDKIDALVKSFNILLPDLSIILDDDDVSLALTRATETLSDRIESESIDFFANVRQGFLQRLSEPYVKKIVANNSIENVHLDILHSIRSNLCK